MFKKYFKAMKHTINLFLMIAIASIAMFSACNDDEVVNPALPTIDHKEIDVKAVGGKTLINVNTDKTWNASVDVDWARVSPSSGNGSIIVNAEIDKNLGSQRTGKINFVIGSATSTVNITQRGIDTAKFLSEQVNRRVRQTEFNGTTVTIVWDDPTPNCGITELEYEILPEGWARIVVANDETRIECTNAKADSPYRVRSGFIVPLMGDTLYGSWTVSQNPLLSSFPTGTLNVHPRSYRWDATTGNLSGAVPVSEFATPRTVELEAVSENVYRISDMFGGFYTVGRNYSDPVTNTFSPYGVFTVDGGTYSLTEYGRDNWGSGFNKIEGYNNPTRGTLTLDIYWNNGGLVFHLILCQESSRLDRDGYIVVDELPFSENGKYERNAIRWPGGYIGGNSPKYGTLAYKVTVNQSGKLKVIDHVSPDYNIYFVLHTDKTAADAGDGPHYAPPVDGTLEYDVTPGTYYVFGLLNTWYPDIGQMTTIDYDIEITLE
jgi:hypothetical protein